MNLQPLPSDTRWQSRQPSRPSRLESFLSEIRAKERAATARETAADSRGRQAQKKPTWGSYRSIGTAHAPLVIDADGDKKGAEHPSISRVADAQLSRESGAATRLWYSSQAPQTRVKLPQPVGHSRSPINKDSQSVNSLGMIPEKQQQRDIGQHRDVHAPNLTSDPTPATGSTLSTVTDDAGGARSLSGPSESTTSEIKQIGQEPSKNVKEGMRGSDIDEDEQRLNDFRSMVAALKRSRAEKAERDRAMAREAARAQNEEALHLDEAGRKRHAESRSEVVNLQQHGGQRSAEASGLGLDNRTARVGPLMIGTDEAASLMARNNLGSVRDNGVIDRLQHRRGDCNAGHLANHRSAAIRAIERLHEVSNTQPVTIPEYKKKKSHNTDHKPIELEKVTADDWVIFELFNKGYKAYEISELGRRVLEQPRSDKYIRVRWRRMKLTFPDLVSGHLRRADLSTVANTQIDSAQGMSIRAPSIHLTGYGHAPGESGGSGAVEELATRPRRPTTGGKTISQDLATYLEAVLEPEPDPEEMDPMSSVEDPSRYSTPDADDDAIHFAYRILRRTLHDSSNDGKVEWFQCGDVHDDVTSANEAANNEMVLERDAVDVWPWTKMTLDTNAETDGLCCWTAHCARATIQVKVEKFTRALDTGIRPTTKRLWIKRTVFDVWERITSVEEVEVTNRSPADRQDLNTSTDTPRRENSQSSTREPTPEADDSFGEADADTLVTSFTSASDTPKTYPAHGSKEPTVLANQTSEPRSTVRNTSTRTSAVGSVYGSRDRANRAAGAHYLKLQREHNPDRALRRQTIENGQLFREELARINEHCDGLEQDEENFVEEATFDMDENDWEDEDGAGPGGSRIVERKIEVWTQERRFENPRNLL